MKQIICITVYFFKVSNLTSFPIIKGESIEDIFENKTSGAFILCNYINYTQ